MTYWFDFFAPNVSSQSSVSFLPFSHVGKDQNYRQEDQKAEKEQIFFLDKASKFTKAKFLSMWQPRLKFPALAITW